MRSNELTQNLWVIQGSLSGPFFYHAYSNNINFVLTDNPQTLYADDTGAANIGNDLTISTNHVNSELANILEWCRFINLLLAPEN